MAIAKKTLRQESIPAPGLVKILLACEFAAFHRGQDYFVVIEEKSLGRQVKWLMKLVKMGEEYDADWQFITTHEEHSWKETATFAVLVKKA